MTFPLSLTRLDVLHIVQSLAQSLRGADGRQVEGSLFLEISTTESFSSKLAGELALSALRFFALDSGSGDIRILVSRLRASSRLEDWADVLFDRWDKDSICFRSSGSTGQPVAHRYDMVALADEIDAAAPFFPDRRRVVSVMPVHHIFGMMYGPMLSKRLGVPLVHAPPLPLASFFALLRPGDVLVGFPFFWQTLLEMIAGRNAAPEVRFPANLVGLTATSPCPPGVITGLLNLSGTGKSPSLVALKEIYGSTETNGVGMRHDGGDWYELFSLWQSVPLADGTRGILRVRSDGAACSAQPLPDVALWHDDRHFRPERRFDNAVQVGGVNVYPDKVAAVIRDHPLVRDCAVRLMRPEEGVRLKAFIVPALPLDEAANVFGKDFRDWMAARLDTACRPKLVRLGTELPVNAMGKARDWD